MKYGSFFMPTRTKLLSRCELKIAETIKESITCQMYKRADDTAQAQA
jgi:hypothetical protein